MLHIEEKVDTIIVGLYCIMIEILIIPIIIGMFLFDLMIGIKESFMNRCVRPVQTMIKREVRWYYHPEEDPVYRKAKGL